MHSSPVWQNKWVFLVGFIFAQILLPLRIVRSTFLAQTVDQKVQHGITASRTLFPLTSCST